MEIRNKLEVSTPLQGVPSSAPTSTQQPTNAPAATTGSAALAQDQATLSNVGNGAAQMSSSDEVRMDKVTHIQGQLAAGTYNVSPSAVASKMVDSLLTNGK